MFNANDSSMNGACNIITVNTAQMKWTTKSIMTNSLFFKNNWKKYNFSLKMAKKKNIQPGLEKETFGLQKESNSGETKK